MHRTAANASNKILRFALFCLLFCKAHALITQTIAVVNKLHVIKKKRFDDEVSAFAYFESSINNI